MKDKINDLIFLQDCDNRIQEIINKKNEGPLRIKKLEDEVNSAESKFQEEHNRLELFKKDRRGIEQEIQDFVDNMEKSTIKLSNIKSNKEYRAALKEIEDFKKSKFQAEDKAIQLMEEIEDLEKKCRENKEKQAELVIRFEKGRDVISKELDSLDRELKSLEKKRGDYAQTIDQELLKRYLFLKDHKGGRAISPVVGGVCQACYMGMPPQKFNESIKGQSLLTCPNCDRIIYWGEDEHYQKALNQV